MIDSQPTRSQLDAWREELPALKDKRDRLWMSLQMSIALNGDEADATRKVRREWSDVETHINAIQNILRAT